MLTSLKDNGLKTALDMIESSESAKKRFIQTYLLESALMLIELKDKDNEFTNIRYYTCFDDVASKGARGEFVTHLLDLRLDYQSNQEQ
ncbi:MAG: hypothetical protein ABEI13_04010, partial [Candidatus Paceibacteria bacterium]